MNRQTNAVSGPSTGSDAYGEQAYGDWVTDASDGVFAHSVNTQTSTSRISHWSADPEKALSCDKLKSYPYGVDHCRA